MSGCERAAGRSPGAALALAALLAALLAASLAAGCGASSGATSAPRAARAATVAARAPIPAPPPEVSEPGVLGPAWQVVASVEGVPAAWLAERGGVVLLRLDQRRVHLALHAGLGEPGGGGWPHGDRISLRERRRVIAAFNGGFKLSYGSVGFAAGGRVAVPLRAGLGSIVTYANGVTDIGAWEAGVPAAGEPVASVLQNLHLLVDRATPASTVESCAEECWGQTLGGGLQVARSALAVTAGGELLWAAGAELSPAGLAAALVQAGAVRAVELDINPEWTSGYLYVHHQAELGPVAILPGQHGIPGALLTPYERDFFTALAA